MSSGWFDYINQHILKRTRKRRSLSNRKKRKFKKTNKRGHRKKN